MWQIDVDDRDDFDHFVFDSKLYSPFHNDKRVIVSHVNRFKIKEITQKTLECGR